MRASVEPWFFSCTLIALTTTGIVPILIPLEVVEVAGSPANVGLIMAAIGAGMLTSPLWAALATRFRCHKLLMVLAAAGVGVALWGFDRSDHIYEWLGYAFLTGCCVASAFTLANIIIVSIYPANECEERISWLQTLVTVGTVVGLAVAGSIEYLPFSAGVVAGGVTSGLAALLAFLYTPSPPPPARVEVDSSGQPAPRWSRPLLVMLLFWFLSNAGVSGYNALYPLVMLHEFRVSPAAASYVLAASSAGSTLVFVLSAKLVRQYGTTRLLLLALAGRLVALVVLCVLSYMEFEGRVVIALSLFAGVTLLWPLISVSATLLVSDMSTTKGRSLGLLDGSAAMAHLAGPVMAGYLANRFGYEAVIDFAAVGVGLGLLLGPQLKAQASLSQVG